ncbi:MAG: S8 family serine peptidase [Candidatus Eisenbacteria bacterium]|nr:S8 family serine peptidase [Candidatus Eisenbacteria bacterium]
MSPHQQIPERTGPARIAAQLLALGLALVLASCSRQAPLSPLVGVSPLPGHPGNATADQTGDPQEVVLSLLDVRDAPALAVAYAVTLIETDDEGYAKFLAPFGTNPDTVAARMALDPRVASAERNVLFEPAETRQQSWAFDDGGGTPKAFMEQPAGAAIHLSQAHRFSQGAGVTIAILDNGADASHPALRGHVVGGWNFVDRNSDFTDRAYGVDSNGNGILDEALGHGTHVAGIAALTAPAARLLIVRVLNSDGRGDVMDVASGIRWAMANGARVINLSLGTLQESPAIKQALNDARATGVVCVASAGNWGAEHPEEYPAHAHAALAVAAMDAMGTAAPFTSFGGFVAVSAPGVGVRSAFPGNRYMLWSGTSMSAPFVSGTSALLLSLHPNWNHDQVIQRLTATAGPVATSRSEQAGKLGVGSLDAGAALRADSTMAWNSGGGDGDLTRRK